MAVGAILGQRSGIQTISGQQPDPNGNVDALLTSGGTMQGNVNMNNNKITELPNPVANNEPETLGHAKQTYVAKENVANNFTTTEPGFVADARAVAELYKNKANITSLFFHDKKEITISYKQKTGVAPSLGIISHAGATGVGLFVIDYPPKIIYKNNGDFTIVRNGDSDDFTLTITSGFLYGRIVIYGEEVTISAE